MWGPASSHVLLAVFSTYARQCLSGSSTLRLEDDPLMRGWMDHVQSLPTHFMQDTLADKKTPATASYNFTLHWFDQRLDHVNKQQRGRWWQRYFVYDKFSRLERNYPLFVFCGAEQGDIYREWERLGFMLDVARAHGAKVIWLEHRFFGASMPFEGAEAFEKRVDRVGLLSLEQSLADYAAIVREHMGDGPVLTFGGSLSGTMAAMMRVQFPTLIDMAYASSAPILGVDGIADPFAWRKRLTDNFVDLGSHQCPEKVRSGFAAMQAAQADPTGEAGKRLWNAIKPCEKMPISAARWQSITNMAWAELERLGNYVYPPAMSGIGAACKRMEGTKSGEEVFAALLNLNAPGYCYNFTAAETPSSGVETTSGVGHGWSYMACTEVIHPIAANGKTDMFPAYDWTVPSLEASCKPGWNVVPDADYIRHKLDIKVDGFGTKAKVLPSKALPGKVLFTYGDYDPWGTMVPKEGWADDVKSIRVPGGSHCSDLETPRPQDTPEMIDARSNISAVLTEWLEEVRKMRIMKVNGFGSGIATHQPSDTQAFGKGQAASVPIPMMSASRSQKLRGTGPIEAAHA